MKRLLILSLVAVLMTVFAAGAMAATKSGASMKAKVASFDFIVDQSGSMMMTDKKADEVKFNLAKQALARVNDRIPELGYTGSIHTFAKTGSVLSQRVYNRTEFAPAFQSLKTTNNIYANITPMGDGIRYWNETLTSKLAQPTAGIIVSDGASNIGLDPLLEAQAAIAANPGLCLHVISLADTAKGQAVLDSITALRPECSVNVKATDIINSDQVADQFVRDVFYGGGKIVLRSVQFGFDSAVINSESAAVLDQVAGMVKGRKVEVGGHTCSIGTDAYNEGLSTRRAAAVKNYLVKQGIPAASISAVGYGESAPKYDNKTDEGRRLNRRAEIDFK